MGELANNLELVASCLPQPEEKTHELSVQLEEDNGDEAIKKYTPRNKNNADGCCGQLRLWLKQYLFLWLNVLGVIVGFALAFGLRRVDISEDTIMWLGLPGELFLRLLKLTMVPLIAANVIAGSASVDPASNGRAGLAALIYTIVCNFTGTAIGLLLGYITKPGVGIETGTIELNHHSAASKVGTQDIFIDLIKNLVPDNLVRATMQKMQTTYTESEIPAGNLTEITYVKHATYVDDVNILGLLFFCAVFGVAVGLNKEKALPIKLFFSACADIMLTILGWFIWASPLGVSSLLLVAIIQVPALEAVLIKVIIFFSAVTGGVLFQELILFPSLYCLACRRNPFPILVSSARAWAIAFASASSSCSMPEIFNVAAKQHCDTALTSLTIPICVTLNAAGSSLFISFAVLFLAQSSNMALSAGQYGVIWMLTSLSSMVLPALANASIVTLVMIVTALSIPTGHIGLLFTIEWFLDRIRATSNVVSDIYGVLIIDHYCKNTPPKVARTMPI